MVDRHMNSPLHPIQVDFSQSAFHLVTFSEENNRLDRDILVNIELASQWANTILALESGAMMASFTPWEEDCRRFGEGGDNEFILVIDFSGLMQSWNRLRKFKPDRLINWPVEKTSRPVENWRVIDKKRESKKNVLSIYIFYYQFHLRDLLARITLRIRDRRDEEFSLPSCPAKKSRRPVPSRIPHELFSVPQKYFLHFRLVLVFLY